MEEWLGWVQPCSSCNPSGTAVFLSLQPWCICTGRSYIADKCKQISMKTIRKMQQSQKTGKAANRKKQIYIGIHYLLQDVGSRYKTKKINDTLLELRSSVYSRAVLLSSSSSIFRLVDSSLSSSWKLPAVFL